MINHQNSFLIFHLGLDNCSTVSYFKAAAFVASRTTLGADKSALA